MTPSDGHYSYRFSGFSRQGRLVFFVAGVGVMRIRGGWVDSGRHEASVVRLKDSGEMRSQAAYELTGRWELHPAGAGLLSAEILLTQVAPAVPDPQVLQTRFAAVPAGDPDRFWLVSMGAVWVSGPPVIPSELTAGEMVRIGD
jgi:hypothetical protein